MIVNIPTDIFAPNAVEQVMRFAAVEVWNSATTAAARANEMAISETASITQSMTRLALDAPRTFLVLTECTRTGIRAKKKFTKLMNAMMMTSSAMASKV